ncbi:hypothetical protein SELMODRAFT_125243 [Selaginella moellendorffii]|uniref:DUF309 domain-containing protein n=2 Tax=Selaginella moellendorffii TaxID=88036 RepID=D8SUR0_SELML|nr:hypothetical protein SELMODRAFT_125243 [Selaginella moellendorffii]
MIARGWRWEESEAFEESFSDAVDMFNKRDYYKCHDIFEALWNDAEEPQRTLLHALLQSSVGLYHLLNQNYRGAMVELGEGVSKFGKLKLKKGPFYEFDKEMRAVLDFLYNTQLENAACNDDFCITMDGSQENYQLLGNFGAGEELYKLEKDVAGYGHSLIFSPTRVEQKNSSPSVKLPILLACEGDLNEL